MPPKCDIHQCYWERLPDGSMGCPYCAGYRHCYTQAEAERLAARVRELEAKDG